MQIHCPQKPSSWKCSNHNPAPGPHFQSSHCPPAVSSESATHPASQTSNHPSLLLPTFIHTFDVPFVVVGPIDHGRSLVVSTAQPVRSENPASSLGSAAHAALFSLWEDLPPEVVDGQGNAGSGYIWQDRPAEEVVLAVVPVDSFSVVEWIVKYLACGLETASFFVESFLKRNLVAVVEGGRRAGLRKDGYYESHCKGFERYHINWIISGYQKRSFNNLMGRIVAKIE